MFHHADVFAVLSVYVYQNIFSLVLVLTQREMRQGPATPLCFNGLLVFFFISISRYVTELEPMKK